jgi:hypothetical protein
MEPTAGWFIDKAGRSRVNMMEIHLGKQVIGMEPAAGWFINKTGGGRVNQCCGSELIFFGFGFGSTNYFFRIRILKTNILTPNFSKWCI